jgi:DNA topoisomerase II
MAKQYKKMDPISHCLERPDMYVGSTNLRTTTEYIAECVDSEYKIYQKDIQSSPAILRIFIEVLSNAIDNVERSKGTSTPCKKIAITLDEESGETSVWNDGDVVPIEINEEEGCYNHTMIFGQLLTGSNYDDDQERILAGRNGIGAKACSIFSKKFIVEGCDPSNKKMLTQTWTNNMRTVSKPIIKACKSKGYTHVTWWPDFDRFGLEGYTADLVKLYTRYVIDAAMISKVQVYLNNELVPVKSLLQYAPLYDVPTQEKLLIKTPTCEVMVTPARQFEAISFVNGMYTRLGGQHVDAWSEAIFRPIVDKFNGKDKKVKTKQPKINISDVRQFFRLFVVSTVVRPEFNGQNKEKLESPGVVASVKPTHINAIFKWSVIEQIEDIIKTKEMVALKKVSSSKQRQIKVDGLDPANNSGGKQSHECSLFICEGLSAKTYVVAGIDEGVYGKKGRDWFGILPVTGKILNVRNATPTNIAANKVIVSIIQSLGLQYGLDYTKDVNFKTLRYGKIISICDADDDGVHIEGLLVNFLHNLFPTLLQCTTPFIVSMKTPIARVSRPRCKDILFYDERRFINYVQEQTQKYTAKYYKGLGTTRAEDVPDTFGKKMVEYVHDDDVSQNMNKIFHKKYADDRKKWLGEYDHGVSSFSLDDQKDTTKMKISDFLNHEMIKFSHSDCARSLPHGIDGLKESQRKILYAVRKRNLKYSGTSLKVAQLSGYTAEHSNYHHGEQNLQDTIVNMASGYTGTNNIPLLYPDGGFGTRLEGGKDAASARYIYTKLEAMTEYIFRSEDDPLLTQVNDDGDLVQPEHYVPIIPMILVNGCTAGIGTGWSCTIPCYNPKDLVESIRVWLENDGEVLLEDPDNGQIISMLPEIIPWYRGFNGDISSDGTNRYITTGIVNKTTPVNTYSVTELPIGMWTCKFKDICEDLVVDKKLKSVKNHSNVKDVNFTLTKSVGDMKCDIDNLKLYSYVYTSNMVLFTAEGKLKKYDNTDQIIDSFCKVRYDYYIKRKAHQIKTMEKELKFLGNKERFIREVISKKLSIMNEDESTILTNLKNADYDEEPEVGGYDYLLRMQVRTFTAEKVNQLEKDIKGLRTKLDIINKTSENKMWLNDLNEFEKYYDKWVIDMDNRSIKKTKK